MAPWPVNVYVIAPLAGSTWFLDGVNHATAFLGHAASFGDVSVSRGFVCVLRGA